MLCDLVAQSVYPQYWLCYIKLTLWPFSYTGTLCAVNLKPFPDYSHIENVLLSRQNNSLSHSGSLMYFVILARLILFSCTYFDWCLTLLLGSSYTSYAWPERSIQTAWGFSLDNWSHFLVLIYLQTNTGQKITPYKSENNLLLSTVYVLLLWTKLSLYHTKEQKGGSRWAKQKQRLSHIGDVINERCLSSYSLTDKLPARSCRVLPQHEVRAFSKTNT